MTMVFLLIVVVTLSLGGGCATRRVSLTPQMLSEATLLHESLAGANVHSIEARIGDSLFVLAQTQHSTGRDTDAFANMDLALIFFRLAVARHELAQSRENVRELETSLTIARSKLAEYERILSGVMAEEDEQ